MLALEAGASTRTHILNLLHRMVDGRPTDTPTTKAPQALTLTTEPRADVERYHALRKVREGRHASDPVTGAIIIMLRSLKMRGMAQAVGELTELLKAETADREVRSTDYQLKAAGLTSSGISSRGPGRKIGILQPAGPRISRKGHDLDLCQTLLHARSLPVWGMPRTPGAKVHVSDMRRVLIGAMALLGLGALIAYRYQDILIPWIERKSNAEFIVVSGNIEAHESVVSFKDVQSRIVELPFDEGQAVKAGTVLARVDDADYKQQVEIAEAALNAQTRQLDVAQQNVVASRRTIVSDEADVALKQLEFDRAQTLLLKGAGTTDARDVAETAVRQSRAALDRDNALEASAEKSVALAIANIGSAQATLDLAKIVVGYATLKAPFDGVILVRQAELGEGLCHSNGRSSAHGAARPGPKRPLGREGAPFGQCGRASLLVDLAGDEMALLIEMVVDLGVN